MDAKLTRIDISGFKSFESLNDFKPKGINVLIGPNGAGKSNFISFFRLLTHMFSSDGQLQTYVSTNCGGASALLYDGPEVTPHMDGHLCLETSLGNNEYQFRLSYSAGDCFVFTKEQFRYSSFDFTRPAKWKVMDVGHKESKLLSPKISKDKTAKTIVGLLKQIVVYQFHNTSFTSRFRRKWRIDDRRWLKEDGGNLGVFLYGLKEEMPEYYRRVIMIIRAVMPFFDDFYLIPERDTLLLAWKEQGSDIVFNASQASDGMLRFISLVSLLGQPVGNLPAVLMLDEPELGLHPYALEVVSGLIKSVGQERQVFIATQSPRFVDCFEPEDIVIIDRNGRSSTMNRLDPEDLKDWLDTYSLSEAWEKNVLGGTP